MQKRFLTISLAAVALFGLFQNCGQSGFQAVADLPLSFTELGSTSGSGDTSHPGDPVPQFDSFQEPLVDKTYASQLMRDIFSSMDPDLENRLDEWVNNKGASFGTGCNIYDSRSGRDCGGDYQNANAPVRATATTMRELYVLRICSEVIGLDGAVAAALSKVSLTPTSPTSADGIKGVYQLFFRIDDADDYTINTLMDLDSSLKTAGESQKERWRAILLSICESPGWQQF